MLPEVGLLLEEEGPLGGLEICDFGRARHLRLYDSVALVCMWAQPFESLRVYPPLNSSLWSKGSSRWSYCLWRGSLAANGAHRNAQCESFPLGSSGGATPAAGTRYAP